MLSSQPAGVWPLPGSPKASNLDRERFEHEVVAQRDALLRFALRLTRDRADAEDLVSDTVLRALGRWGQYRLGTNMRAWLSTILFRLFIAQRRRARVQPAELIERGNDWSPSLPAASADPEQEFFDTHFDGEVACALDDLPAHYRTAVVLSDLQDVPYAEIATRLGIAEGTVKSRIFRARRILQLRLGRYAAELGYGCAPSPVAA